MRRRCFYILRCAGTAVACLRGRALSSDHREGHYEFSRTRQIVAGRRVICIIASGGMRMRVCVVQYCVSHI